MHRSCRTTVITHVVGVCCCMALDQATEALQLHHRYPSNRARHHHGRPIKTWLCANKSQNTWEPLSIVRDSVCQKWCVLVSSIIHESFHFLWLIIAAPQGAAVYPRMHWGRAGKTPFTARPAAFCHWCSKAVIPTEKSHFYNRFQCREQSEIWLSKVLFQFPDWLNTRRKEISPLTFHTDI